MKKLLQDFKAFIHKGNVVDMAIGVIIGGAFGKIVTSLVNDLIMPVIGLILGGNTLSGLSLVINGEPRFLEDGVTANPACLTWNYGNFIQTVIDFLIIAICVFFMVKALMALQNGGKKLKEKTADAIKAKDESADAAPAEAEIAEEAVAAEVAEPVVEEVAEPVKEPVSAETDALLREIRDLLKAQAEKE